MVASLRNGYGGLIPPALVVLCCMRHDARYNKDEMKRTLSKLLLGFLLICPVCERGRMYATQWRMHQYCPQCGTPFERSTGEATGAMAITLVFVTVINLVVGTLLVVLTDIPVWFVLGVFLFFTLVVGPLFYRQARGLWVSFLYLIGALEER